MSTFPQGPDQTPGSTHNDTLVALVEEVWKMGAKTVSLGERSYPLTREVMEQKGVIPLMQNLDVDIVDFDDLAEKDWVKVDAGDSHWQFGRNKGWEDLINLVAIWDPMKQRIAAQSYLYYASHVEQNSSLTARVKAFIDKVIREPC